MHSSCQLQRSSSSVPKARFLMLIAFSSISNLRSKTDEIPLSPLIQHDTYRAGTIYGFQPSLLPLFLTCTPRLLLFLSIFPLVIWAHPRIPSQFHQQASRLVLLLPRRFKVSYSIFKPVFVIVMPVSPC